MSIALGSINTGLPKDIVQQIIKAERIPIERMVERKDKLNDQKNLVIELETTIKGLKSHLAQNSNAKNLREFQINTNDDLVGIILDKNTATTGTYQFEILQLAQSSSVLSSGVPDKDNSYIGVGFIQYYLPDGTSKHLYIDSDDATLSGMAQKINAEDFGVRATVINDGTGSKAPYRLMMTLNASGEKNNTEFPYLYFVDGSYDFYLEEEREAQDAIFKLDGFKIKAPENKITDIIPGATVELRKAMPGEEFSISISEDSEAITVKVGEVVERINAVLNFIKKQNTLDANTDTSRNLGGDSILQILENRLRNIIFTDIQTDSGPIRAGDIGITFTKEGLLQFDQQLFNKKVSENFDPIAQMLTGRIIDGKIQNGLIQNLTRFTNDSIGSPNSIIQTRKKGFQSNMKQIDKRIEQRERILEKKEQTLKTKFARLEATIAKLRTGGAGVAALGGPPVNVVNQLG